MTPENARWAQAYLLGQNQIVDGDAGPECTLDALLALVNLGSHLRAITRDADTPVELALQRLTFAVDDMLATLLVAGDDEADAATVQTWRGARCELDELLDSAT